MKKIPFTMLFAGAAVCGAIIIFARTAAYSVLRAPETEAPLSVPALSSSAAAEAPLGENPKRLIIPAIKVDAAVQYVGINTKGDMMAPNNFTDVGWYKYGALPGQVGNAIFDGHVDNGLALPGVFKHLSDIVVGNEIDVATAESSTLHFAVSEVERYPYEDVPLGTILNKVDGRYLTLITCDGTWVPGQKTYDHRLVIIGELVPSASDTAQ